MLDFDLSRPHASLWARCARMVPVIGRGLRLGLGTWAALAEPAQAAWQESLTPVVIVNGVMHRCPEVRGDDGQKAVSEGCNLEGIGHLTLGRDPYRLTLTADRPLTLSGLGWVGTVAFDDATTFLTNGFHSWSLSGLIAAGPRLKPDEWLRVRSARDDEFRDGRGVSWEYGAIANNREFIFGGALTAERWKPWVEMSRLSPDRLFVQVMSGGTGESLVLTRGMAVASEAWHFAEGAMAAYDDRLRSYGDLLGRTAGQPTRGSPARMGWTSWYGLWSQVSHKSLSENLPVAAGYLRDQFQSLGDLGRRPVAVLDDGWEVRWGDWEPNERFAQGLGVVAKEMVERGMEPGLWIAPWLVSVESPVVQDHPMWFVETEDFEHPSGRYKILDVTHPEVAAHLHGVMSRLVAQGFTYFKLDFLYTGTFEGRRYWPLTGMMAFHRGMEIIKEAVGPHVTLAACGAPGLASRPYFDSWRTGPDIAYQYPTGRPAWADVALQLQNLSARWFLCGSLRCDLDPLLIRGPRPMAEVEAALWTVALGAGGLFVSDDLRQVDQSRRSEALETLALEQALGQEPARPDPPLPLAPPPTLRRISWLDRLMDHSPVRPPVRWQLARRKYVYINSTERDLEVGGRTLSKRESYVE